MINRSISLGICFVLLPSVVGCNPTGLNQPEDTHVELFHDFGEISKGQKGEVLTHDFTIHNRSDRPLKLVGRQSSCSCVLLKGENDSKVIADVPPRSSIQLKAGVSAQSKVGHFAETITLHYEGMKPVTYVLQLQGLVLSPPRPVVDQIRFFSANVSSLQRKCVCTYQRKKNQKPIQLVDANVVYDSDAEPGFTFDIGDSAFESVSGANTILVETWRIPIVLNLPDRNATGTALLELRWSDGSSSTVKLIVESQRQIEVLQSRVMLQTSLGNSYTTRIPVRFTSTWVDGPYEVCSDAEWCRAVLDVQKQAIAVSVDGKSLGRHKCILSLREKGLELFQVEVECVVNSASTANQ